MGFSSLYTAKIDPWDAAPGVLLVHEAGGRVTDFKGDRWKLERSDLVFSNGRVHSALLDLLRPSQARVKNEEAQIRQRSRNKDLVYLVAHTGFEPVISSLRGRCPGPS